MHNSETIVQINYRVIHWIWTQEQGCSEHNLGLLRAQRDRVCVCTKYKVSHVWSPDNCSAAIGMAGSIPGKGTDLNI